MRSNLRRAPEEIDLVRAHPEMADALTAVAWEAKRFWGYPEAWMEAWRLELTIEPSDIERHETWAAVLDGEPIGFFVLSREDDRTGELDHLWVHPDYMGMGIGSRLIRHAIDRATDLGMTTISVEADPNAQPFYVKHGARRVGTALRPVCGSQRELPILVISPA